MVVMVMVTVEVTNVVSCECTNGDEDVSFCWVHFERQYDYSETCVLVN